MNILPFFLCRVRPRLQMAGWVAIGFAISTASAQVEPPAAKDTVTVAPHVMDREIVAIQQKSTAIIIPRVDFHDTPLPDAIEFIRRESSRLDPDPDPAARGLNIFLKLPKGANVSSVHVTTELTDVPVMEALRSVAKLAGLKVKVEPYAVSLVPLSENSEQMFTVSYHVPPTAIGLPADPAPTTSTGTTALEGSPRLPDMKLWLENKGIIFPPGASAAYLIGKHTLVVRDTQENLDRVETLVSSSPKNP